jgi:hypothetical protein
MSWHWTKLSNNSTNLIAINSIQSDSVSSSEEDNISHVLALCPMPPQLLQRLSPVFLRFVRLLLSLIFACSSLTGSFKAFKALPSSIVSNLLCYKRRFLVLRRLESVLFAVRSAATSFFKSASLCITTDILRAISLLLLELSSENYFNVVRFGF